MSITSISEIAGTVDVASLRVGDPLTPIVFAVTDEVVSAFAAVADRTVADSPPSILAAVYTFGVIAQMSATKGAILTGQRYQFYRRPAVGDVLATKAFVAALYVKRGRQYMELSLTTRNASGELVMDARITRIVPAGGAQSGAVT